jgi:hypothetical protein
MAEENRALHTANNHLVAENLKLQEQVQSLQIVSTEPTPGTSTSFYGSTESSSGEVNAMPLVATMAVSASPLVTTRPSACDICGRCYGNRHSLATHKNRVHKMKHCERCNCDFERSLFSGHTCQTDDSTNM